MERTPYRKGTCFPKVLPKHVPRFIRWDTGMSGAYLLTAKPAGSTGVRLDLIRTMTPKQVRGDMMSKIKRRVRDFSDGLTLWPTTGRFRNTISSTTRWERSLIQQNRSILHRTTPD